MKTSSKRNWEDYWGKKHQTAEIYPNTDRIRRYLGNVCDLQGSFVLEVGAGTGRDSFYMAQDGAKLVLLDYSMQSLRHIQAGRPRIDNPVLAVGADAFSMPFPDDAFDVVFHQGLLEHFKEDDATRLLQENIRVLKPGGHLVVDVPQRYHIYTIIKHLLILMNAWFAGWEREFSLKELERILTSLQLQPVLQYGEWMYPSFFYRMLREVLAKLGLALPLYPPSIPLLHTIRTGIRDLLTDSWFQKNTALSIGIIARKPADQ